MKDKNLNNPKQSDNSRRNNNQRNSNKYRNRRQPKEQDKHLDNDIRDLLKTLRFVTYQFVSYVEHSTEEQLLWSQSPSDWNIKHQLGHICQFMTFNTKQIASMLEAKAFGESFDADAEIGSEEFNNRSLEVLLARFRKAKRELFQLLYASESAQWRVSVLCGNSEQMLTDLIDQINTHFATVIDAIFLNLQRHKPWYVPEEPSEEEPPAAEEENVQAEDIEA